MGIPSWRLGPAGRDSRRRAGAARRKFIACKLAFPDIGGRPLPDDPQGDVLGIPGRLSVRTPPPDTSSARTFVPDLVSIHSAA